MTEAELNLLRTELLNAKNYLEFGSGNSTRMAAALRHLQRITVVESDDRFFQTEVASDPDRRSVRIMHAIVPPNGSVSKQSKWQ